MNRISPLSFTNQNMSSSVIIVILLFSEYAFKGNAYVVSSRQSTWHGSSCTMATPELRFTTNGLYIADLTNVHIEEGRSVWIGYFKEYKSFQYIGCPKLNFSGVQGWPVADFGECYSACSLSEYIAIVKTRSNSVLTNTCFCFQTRSLTNPNINWRSNKCDHLCGDAACNDELGDKHIALYQRDFNNYGMFTVNEAPQCPIGCHCLIMLPGESVNSFRWNGCSDDFLAMCNEHKFYENSTSIHYDSQTFRNWLDANNYCNNNDGYYPASTEAAKTANIPQDIPELWTGVLRSLSIVDVAGTNNKQSVGKSYAYVTNESGQLKVRFTNDKQVMRHVLCVEDTSSKLQTITSPVDVSSSHYNVPETSTKSQTIISPANVISSHIKSAETSPTLSTLSTTHVSTSGVLSGSTMSTTSINHRSANDDPLPISAIIGASVGGLILVVIVIGSIVLLKKRGLPAKTERTPETQNAVTYYNMPDERHVYSDLTNNAANSQTYTTLHEANSNENARIPANESAEYVNKNNGYANIASKSANEEYSYENPDVANM